MKQATGSSAHKRGDSRGTRAAGVAVVKLIDLNLLLCTVNADSAQHSRAKSWLETAFSDGEAVDHPAHCGRALLAGFAGQRARRAGCRVQLIDTRENMT